MLIDVGEVPGNVHLFHTCSNAAINLYRILPTWIDELLIIGADQLVVSDLELIYENAKQLGWDENHLLAAPEECVEPRGTCGWYSHDRQTEIRFGDNGINFGSCILSLIAIRKYEFEKWTEQVYQKGTYPITFGDQDLANLYGRQHPDRVLTLQCNSNIRYDSGCDVERLQPITLHGNRQTFATNSNWADLASKVDEIFDRFRKDCGMQLHGASLWEEISAQWPDVTNNFMSSLGKPWGLSPQRSR
mmetsp:Transcript_145184/g.264149  ORF Transcript_145184/g.264149 Transcript_145184/m.264149 type:complete len:246 (-) Transcript_145184:5-742(-)